MKSSTRGRKDRDLGAHACFLPSLSIPPFSGGGFVFLAFQARKVGSLGFQEMMRPLSSVDGGDEVRLPFG